MKSPHILVADWFASEFSLEEPRLREHGLAWSMPTWKPPAPSPEEQERQLLERIAQTEDIVGVLFILAPLTARVIAALPDSCIHLQRVGIGLDTIDLAAAKKRGITVDNTPDYATEEVAVQALASILSLHRQLRPTQRILAAGQWKSQPPHPIERLSTLTLGLIGLGRIGRKLAQLMSPLVAKIVFHDPAVSAGPPGSESVTLPELLARSDIISLHCPLLPTTRKIVDKAALAAMKPGALLINVSRGALIDAEALHEALAAQRIGGAALDVYEPEILPKDSPLHQIDNIVLTSHTAWYSRQSVVDCRTQAIEKLVRTVASARTGSR